jgi:3-oxoadipate enol-lactonase
MRHSARIARGPVDDVVIDLHHRVDGPQEAPSVVLLHAIGTSMRMWAPQVPILSRDHRVISIDLRGHGRSPAPVGPYAMAELARDVIDILDRLEIERASICGLSLGAMVALTMVAIAPDRVDRLVAASVVAVPASPLAWRERAQRVLAGGSSAISDLVVERWGYRDRAPAIAELVRDALATTAPEGYAGCCEAIAGMDLRPDLPIVTAPALLLAGSADPAAPVSVARDMAAAMPDARVTVIEGAAHLLNVEAPTATTDAILEHLRR